jgi:ketosteroid isomerase-like protein
MEVTMTLKEIADALVAGCKAGTERANLKVLYAPDAQSIEAADMGGGRTTTGLAGIEGKHDWWEGAHDIHKVDVTGPYLHGDDRFAVIFGMDVTNKESGQRMQMQEVGIYHVANGKIVREEFFYST